MRLSVPIGIELDVLNAAAAKAQLGDFVDLINILQTQGAKKDVILNFDINAGSGIRTLQFLEDRFDGLDPAIRSVIARIEKFNSIQPGSVTSLRQSVNSLKQQRDQLNATSAEWAEYNIAVQQASAQLRAAQGIQAGSLTDLRRQRDELIKLRDATNRFPSGPPAGNGQSWNDLNKQIKQLDGQIGRITPGFNSLFSTLGKIATVQAGFIAVTSAVGALGGVVNAYVGRTKQIEAFNLALKNVGLTQAETSNAFKEAAAIANRLGAPIQQVEKSYQRMVPALRAVGSSSAQTDKFIENITARTQTLGLNTEQSGRLLEAFAQVLSKGKLQAEELNQQISELDGAFRTQLADAIGVSTEQLTDLVAQGKITAPIFVKAVTSMANGVEELQRRIKNGTATIQQLQNEIGNINVSILGQIGKLIEPGIRTFLNLSLAVAKFFQEFSKTSLFKTFVAVFNQSAKGIEQFAIALLKTASILLQILEPVFAITNAILSFGEGFGGIIGILIAFGGAILTAKAALKGLEIVKNIKGSLQEFSKSALEAGKAQDFLADKANPSRLDKFRQSVSNVTRGIAGAGQMASKAITSFIGLGKAQEQAAVGSATLSKGLVLTEAEFKALVNSSVYGAESLKQMYGITVKSEPALKKTGGSALTAAQQIRVLGGQSALVAYQLNNLANAGIGAAGKLSRTFRNLAKEIVNPLSIATFLIGSLVQNLQAGNDVADQVKNSFSGAFEPINEELDRVKQQSKDLPKTLGDANQTLEQSAKQSNIAGQGFRGLGIGLGVAAVAATVLTGGLGGVALGAGLAAASVASFNKSSKELEKTAFGRALLRQSEDFNKASISIEKRIVGLGGEIGQIDFSNFARGSQNLAELSRSYSASAAATRNYIDAQKEALKEAEKTGNQAAINKAKAEIAAAEKRLQLQTQSEQAVKAEIAARIAAGDAAQAQAASLDELKLAQEKSNDAIDIAKINAQTDALKKYGNLKKQQGQLNAANLAIEKQVSAESLKQSKLQLEALQARVNKGEKLNEDEKKYARDLTKTIAQETKKQVEIQQELGEAIVDGFEKGVQSARKIGDEIAQSAQKVRSVFEGVSSGVSGGLSAALSLVDTVAETELQGLEVGSQKRKQIVAEQIRAAAYVSQVENQIAQIKLAVQNKVAQNEAKVAQLRYQTEAKIAAARGDTDLAKAYTDAAQAQNVVIQGLQAQYKIDSKVLDIQKQIKDQQLIQKGVQEKLNEGVLQGVTPAEKVANLFGIQQVKLGDAVGSLNELASEGLSLSNNFGNAANNLSDMQVAAEETQQSAGELEAAKIQDAFANAKIEVDALNESLNKTKDPVFAALDASLKLQNSLAQTKAILDSVPSAKVPNVPNVRAMGGPVAAGSQYLVNDGGGREGFVNKFGSFSMLPAGRNINWTAPTTGTVIPAHLVDQYRNASEYNKKIQKINNTVGVSSSNANRMSSGIDSGNLIQRVASAMSSSGNTQRITNNVTIQSQEPVTDASKIMTNVARMKLRNSRRI